jgi:hypothetical protein
MSPDDNRRSALEEDKRLQADPELNLSGGRTRTAQLWWVGISAVFVVLLLLFGLSQRGGEENVATNPQQTVPPSTARSDQSGANNPAGQPQTPAAGQNTGTTTGTTERSSEVDAVGQGSVRNPGSGKVSPPPQ